MKPSALLAIIKKNIRLLIRSKTSALVIFLGPLLLVTLLGIAFSNTQQFTASVGVYSEKYSSLTDSLTGKLSESSFKTIKYDAEDKCISSVKRSIVNVCIVFPPDLDITKNESNELSFYVDNSRINLVSMILNALTERVSQESSHLSTELTSVLIDRINKTEVFLQNSRNTSDQLAANNNELRSKINKFYSDLGQLDLNIDVSAFKSAQIGNSSAMLAGVANASILYAQSLVGNLSDAIYDANCSNTYPISKTLAIAQQTFNSYSSNLSTIYNGTGDSFINLMSNLQQQVGAVSSKLQNATDLKNKIIGNPEIKQSLEDNANKIAQLNKLISKLQLDLGSIVVRDVGRIVNPITTRINPVTIQSTYFSYLFPTLVVLIIMLTAILLSSTMVIAEKKSTALFRNAIVPVPDVKFNIGTYASVFLVILVQLAIFLMIGGLFFGANLLPALLVTASILFFVITIFVFFGMIVGYMFRSEETSTLGSITISFILLFFSSTVLPIETMPAIVQNIAYLNPFVISEAALRQSIVFSYGFGTVANLLYAMAAYSAVLFLASLGVQKAFKKQHLFHKYKIKIK